MFFGHCPHCSHEELFGPRRIETLINGERGIGVVYRCSACHELAVLLTGAPTTPELQDA